MGIPALRGTSQTLQESGHSERTPWLVEKVFSKRSNLNSHFDNFTQFLGVSAFDEEGISYKMPDHVYVEESRDW